MLIDPSCLHYDSLSRICDLRSGVSYHRGRCILYLLARWIKGHHTRGDDETRTYTFLLPRTQIKLKQTKRMNKQHGETKNDEGVDADAASSSSSTSSHWCVSPLEQILFQSYSCEYLLTQYFDRSHMQVHIHEPTNDTMRLASVTNPYSKQEVDQFGRPINEQPFVRFTINYPAESTRHTHNDNRQE